MKSLTTPVATGKRVYITLMTASEKDYSDSVKPAQIQILHFKNIFVIYAWTSILFAIRVKHDNASDLKIEASPD